MSPWHPSLREEPHLGRFTKTVKTKSWHSSHRKGALRPNHKKQPKWKTGVLTTPNQNIHADGHDVLKAGRPGRLWLEILAKRAITWNLVGMAQPEKKPINRNILDGTVLGKNRNRPWDKRDPSLGQIGTRPWDKPAVLFSFPQ